MREILFRAMAINREEGREYRTNYKNGDWVYGLLTRHEDVWDCAKMTNEDSISNIDVAEQTLGQYTGLTDKNGTKMFEWDIVRLNNQIGTIVYEKGCFGIGFKEYINYESLAKSSREKTANYYDGIGCDNFIALLEIYWNFNDTDDCIEEIEVIGNRWDTPELLKNE